MSLSVSFLGAAETVTGSRYLVETDSFRGLVDDHGASHALA